MKEERADTPVQFRRYLPHPHTYAGARGLSPEPLRGKGVT